MQSTGVCVCVCVSELAGVRFGYGRARSRGSRTFVVRNGEREGWEAGLVRWMDGLMDGRQMAG